MPTSRQPQLPAASTSLHPVPLTRAQLLGHISPNSNLKAAVAEGFESGPSAEGPGELLKENNHSQADASRVFTPAAKHPGSSPKGEKHTEVEDKEDYSLLADTKPRHHLLVP